MMRLRVVNLSRIFRPHKTRRTALNKMVRGAPNFPIKDCRHLISCQILLIFHLSMTIGFSLYFVEAAAADDPALPNLRTEFQLQSPKGATQESSPPEAKPELQENSSK